MNYKTTQHLFHSFSETVLLVGNGPIKNKAELIDSYDTVIRFNEFRINGFEEHVGTKISAIGMHTCNLHAQRGKNLRGIYNVYVDIIPIFTFDKGTKKYTGNMHLLQHNTAVFSPGLLVSNTPPLSLSTGICTALNLALFFNKCVHLIGFDFMKTGHYWDDNHAHSQQHNGEFEKSIINKISTINVL
jgi:hypothetical protein